ncbi:endochitinase A-like [Oreochromis aureus]|uniref:endochitinase A-like n=1 Tax=Oreochromis aureus TaxID=47969 RepID=UPI001954690F|nr:endochitinase A-like [Oreochromis aureus]
MEEGSLTQLWGYCRSITQAVDPHKRHIQVVFFDNYLSSTTFSMSCLDIDKLIQIVTELRASSSFELFGLGCPGKEDAAASLAALAAWFFLHRRRVFPPPLAAHLLDPPLQGRRRPTPSPLIPSMSSVSADKGSAALVTTVSKPDSGTLLNPVSHEQEGTDSFDAAPPSRKRRRRRHLHQTEAHLTPVVSEEPADSGLAAGLAAQGAAVSEMDSVVGKDVFVMKTERASFKPRDSAQSVNNKTGIAMGSKLRRSALPESGGGPEAIPGSFSNVRSIADCFSGAGYGAFVCEPVGSKTVNTEGAGVAAKWTEAVNSELLHCANRHPDTVFVAADLLKDPVLANSATTGNREAGVPPRASPEAELEASVASGPLDVAEAAVTLSSSQPFMLAISPSTQPAAQLVTQLSSVSASTSPARPSSSPPAATASPSSPPDQPSIAASQSEQELSERGSPPRRLWSAASRQSSASGGSPRCSRRRSSASGGSPRRRLWSSASGRSPPRQLWSAASRQSSASGGSPPRQLWSAASRQSSASGGSPRRSRRRSPPRRLWSSASRRSSASGGSPHHLRRSSVSRSWNSASGRSGYRQERGPAGRRSAHRLSWSCRGRSCSRSRSRSLASKRSARHRERGSAGRRSAHSHRRSAGGRNPISLRGGSVCRVHVQRALHAVHVQRARRHGLFYSVARQSCNAAATGSVARQSCNAAATGSVAARRSCSAATTGRLAGHQRCSTAATGSVAGPQNCFVAAAGPMAVRRRSSVSTDGLKVGLLNGRRPLFHLFTCFAVHRVSRQNYVCCH